MLKKGSSGKYHLNLVASNGQVIATTRAPSAKPLIGHECGSGAAAPIRQPGAERRPPGPPRARSVPFLRDSEG